MAEAEIKVDKHTEGSSLKTLVNQPVAVTSSMALLGGLLAGTDAEAALITTEVDLLADNSFVKFDLDGDGFEDFGFGAADKIGKIGGGGKGNSKGSVSITKLKVKGETLDKGKRTSKLLPFAKPYALGDSVGPAEYNRGAFLYLLKDFKLFDGREKFQVTDDYGPLKDVGSSMYVGLSLTYEGGNTNYGWIHLTRGSIAADCIGFETDPNTPALITSCDNGQQVPEPSSLALLAGGALGMALLRRRRKAQTV